MERAAQHAMKAGTGDHLDVPENLQQASVSPQNQAMEDRGWAGVEGLVGRVAGVRDAVRRLASASNQPGSPMFSEVPEASTSSASVNSLAEQKDRERRRPFWKRKASGSPQSSALNLHPADVNKKSTSALSAALAAVAAPALPNGVVGPMPLHPGHNMTGHLNALLADLDSVVADFSKLVAENKQRRWLNHRASQQQTTSPMASRVSMESSASEEFFDAEDALADTDQGRVVILNDDESSAHEASSSTAVTDDEESDEEDESFDQSQATRSSDKFRDDVGATDANGVRDLSPLPLEPVQRRSVVPAATVMPPSLIGFLRKNVSGINMAFGDARVDWF